MYIFPMCGWINGYGNGNWNSKLSSETISQMDSRISTDHLSSPSVKSISVFSEHET
jgi:hypothetical protein